MGLLDWFKRNPKVPNLYPGLSEPQLINFLTEEEFQRLRKLRRILVLPLASEDQSPEEIFVGTAVARVLIRDLMLLRDVSTRGPEDTPEVPHDLVADHVQDLLRENDALLTGQIKVSGPELSVDLELWTRQGHGAVAKVRETSVPGFTTALASAAAKLLNATVTPAIERSWSRARPSSLATLQRYGELLQLEDPEQSRACLALMDADPSFALPGHHVAETEGGLRAALRAFQRDPEDAQLCFLLYCALHQMNGKDLRAFQFCRRAVELSPGHGKAHMCTPHAGWQEKMLNHSELGMYLLPGNNFAVSNYSSYLHAAGASHERVLEMSLFGLQYDEHDPHLYHQVVHGLEKLGRDAEALAYARRLRALFGPPANRRTIECLNQNAETKRRLASGAYNPLAEADAIVARLARKVGPTES